MNRSCSGWGWSSIYSGGCLTPPFANPGVAEKAPLAVSAEWCGIGVYSLLEIPTDSYHFPSHVTPSSDPNSHSLCTEGSFSYPRVSTRGVRHLPDIENRRPGIATNSSAASKKVVRIAVNENRGNRFRITNLKYSFP